MPNLDFTEYKNTVAELKDMIGGYGTDMTSLKTENAEFKERFDKINEALDQLEFDFKTNKPEPSPDVVSAKHTDLFQKALIHFAKSKDRTGMHKTFAENLDAKYHQSIAAPSGEVKSENLVRFDFAAAGALLVPATIQQEIIKDVREATPVLSVVRVTQSSAEAHKRRVRTSTPGGRWLEEEAKNEKGKPTYKIIRIPLHKWASMYGWTIEQELDSAYNLVVELMEAFRDDFAEDFGRAFVRGDGVGKPNGMVGNISNYNSGSLALTSDTLIRMQAQLKDSYQANSTWMFDRFTRAYIRSVILAAGNDLNGAWEPDLTRRSPGLLLGQPMIASRPGDLAGQTHGNFTAADVPIIYGDFRQGYEATTGAQMYMIDDPFSESDSFVRSLHIMNRVGGDVIKPEALYQLTITSS